MISPLLLIRYSSAAKASKKVANNQVREFYQKNYPDNQAELDATLWHYSRVGTSAALEALFVYNAAKGINSSSRAEALEIAGLQRNAVKLSSMRDQWLDDIYIKKLAESGKIDVKSIRADIANENWQPDILSEPLEITVDKPAKFLKKEEIRTFEHQVYFNAAKILQELYSEGIKERSEEAYAAYRKYKSAVEEHQAKDMAIAAHLIKRNDEGALKILDASNCYEAVISCQNLLDKLGIIGGAIPVIVNEMSGGNNKDKEAVNRELYTLGRELTRFQQLVADDVPNFYKDLRERNPNMLILPALTGGPVYRNQNVKTLISFFEKNKSIINELVSPMIDGMFKTPKKLDELNFAGDEAKFTVKTIAKDGLRNVRILDRSLGAYFFETWYQDVEYFQKKW